MDLYVYYQVRQQHAATLQSRVAAMQAGFADKHGIAVALKRRPEIKDGSHTWMEVYLDIPEDFDVLLARTVTAIELSSLIDGERHAEYFLDLSPCA